MILSDRSIREELAAGRIVLDPFDDSFVQPASVDVRLDRYFRVFLNHTMPVIDVKKNLEELTRLVEIDDDRPFVLHPGEFVLGSTYERVALPRDLGGCANRREPKLRDSPGTPVIWEHRERRRPPGAPPLRNQAAASPRHLRTSERTAY